MKLYTTSALFVAALLAVSNITGCAKENVSPFPSISPEARGMLGAKVNCATAQNDIQLLQNERATVGRQIIAGVRSVFPIAAVAGLLSGDYTARTEVATGKYNDDINMKIDEIRRTCRIQ